MQVQSFTARMPLLTATSAFGLGRRHWSSPQQCYIHCLRTSELYRTYKANPEDDEFVEERVEILVEEEQAGTNQRRVKHRHFCPRHVSNLPCTCTRSPFRLIVIIKTTSTKPHVVTNITKKLLSLKKTDLTSCYNFKKLQGHCDD